VVLSVSQLLITLFSGLRKLCIWFTTTETESTVRASKQVGEKNTRVSVYNAHLRYASFICFAVYFRIELYYHDAVDKMRYQLEVSVQWMVSELETGGNVRYEDGRPSDLWLGHDIIWFYFCAVIDHHSA